MCVRWLKESRPNHRFQRFGIELAKLIDGSGKYDSVYHAGILFSRWTLGIAVYTGSPSHSGHSWRDTIRGFGSIGGRSFEERHGLVEKED
jgi:hypothetical protein